MPVFRRVATLSVVLAAYCLGATLLAAEPGYFSVAKIDGVWWFIDPQGQPFYSLGVSDIGPGSPRETYDPNRPAYAAFRHYGSTQEWADDTLKRLKSWNFNTLGSWVHSSLTHGPMPYAEVLHLGAHAGVPWNDLFSDAFLTRMNELARDRVAPRRSDRNLIGWFTDNELSWYPDTLFDFQLSQPPTSATRAKLLEVLSEHYRRDFALLQRDFDVADASGFDDLKGGGKLKLRPGGQGRSVILLFAAAVAERYYKVMHDTIRRYDANHLILGGRYPWHSPKVVAQAAGPYVDVISTNFDWPEATDGYLPCGYLRNLHSWTGRPVLVTEYYVAADENRSGNKNTGGIFLTVDSQAARAKAAQNRLRMLAEQPFVVGAHWFRFADEPPHGRQKDGEDYNFGLVDIDNRPYEALVGAMARLNSDVPRLHKASRPGNDADASAVRIPLVQTRTSKLHHQLIRTQSLGPIGDSLGVYELLAAWNPDKLYVVALVCHVSEREIYSPELPANDHKLELLVSAPGMDSPVRIRFGGSMGASADDDQVECWISANGLRHTLVVALPAIVLRRPAFKPNEEIDLQLTLHDLRDEETARWRNTCVLAADQGNHAGSKPKPDEVDQRSVSPLPVSAGQ